MWGSLILHFELVDSILLLGEFLKKFKLHILLLRGEITNYNLINQVSETRLGWTLCSEKNSG